MAIAIAVDDGDGSAESQNLLYMYQTKDSMTRGHWIGPGCKFCLVSLAPSNLGTRFDGDNRAAILKVLLVTRSAPNHMNRWGRSWAFLRALNYYQLKRTVVTIDGLRRLLHGCCQ